MGLGLRCSVGRVSLRIHSLPRASPQAHLSATNVELFRRHHTSVRNHEPMPWANSARGSPRHPWFARRSSKSIFRPRVGCIRVAAHFPEAEDVAVEKDNFADELRPFPRVTLRDDQARRAAVLLRQGLAFHLCAMSTSSSMQTSNGLLVE